MKKKILYMSVLVLFFIFTTASLYAQFTSSPKEEVRGVWITTLGGLDWPKSFDPAEQKRSLLEIIENLHQSKFNTVIFQVRSRGDAFYRSSFEPWARELTGTLGRDPGWDPLSFIIEEAHARGMEVHAWFNVYKVWGQLPLIRGTVPEHVLAIRPDWGQIYNNEWWLDPGHPEVNEYLLRVALDVIEKYPVDGIHFDHVRYPGRDFSDESTYHMYADERDRDEWRRENINMFLREFYQLATAIRPHVKVGAAPIGVYNTLPGFTGSTAFFDYYQDAERWLREGFIDYISPQVYWDVATNPKFDYILSDWSRRTHGRHIYSGIGIFKPEIFYETDLQLAIGRALGIRGHVFFRYEHLLPRLGEGRGYSHLALIPPMPWKSIGAPVPPTRVAVTPQDDLSYFIQWADAMEMNGVGDGRKIDDVPRQTAPPAAQRYAVYRSSTYPIDLSNPAHLVAVLPARLKQYSDRIQKPTDIRYHYLITSLDDYFVESEPSQSRSAPLPVFERIANLLGREIFLSYDFVGETKSELLISFYMPAASNVSLYLVDSTTNSTSHIIEGNLGTGTHAIRIHVSDLPNNVICVLKTDETKTERLIKIPRVATRF